MKLSDQGPCKLVIADYLNPKHATDIGCLLDDYARDPMGGGKALDNTVKENIAHALSQQHGAFSILAYIDEQAVGLANCFQGFSTFACKPLINIHDIAVIAEHRGHGLCQKILDKIEQIAISKGCCKITLEVLERNKGAQRAYQKFGFSSYELDPEMGSALFWEKSLKGP